MLFTSLPCRTRPLHRCDSTTRTPGVWRPSRGSGFVSFGWGTHQGRRRSVRSQMGLGKRIVFQSDSVVWREKSSLKSPTVVLPDPFSTTPYSLTHRLFPFRDYGCCFQVPWCRSHRSRGTCATDALRRDATRRTSFVLITERGEPFWKLFIGRGGESSYLVI